jgi:hypothetical protein
MSETLARARSSIETALTEFGSLERSLAKLQESLTELNNYNEKAWRFLADASELYRAVNYSDPPAALRTLPIERHCRARTDRQLYRKHAQETRVFAEHVRDAQVKRLFLKLADELDNGREV